MAIFKAKLESNYAVIPNSALQDKEISYEATGLLAMMLSLPDNWEIHKSWLQEQKVKCGRDKLTSIMNELVENGYVRKQVKQGDDGRLNGVDWLVYPESTVQLKTRKTVKPLDGESDTTKETDLQSKQDTNLIVQPKAKPSIDEEFELFWMHGTHTQIQQGLKKVNKAAAKKSFKAQVNKLPKGFSYSNGDDQFQGAMAFAMMIIDDIEKRCQSGQFGFENSLHPTTYLNNQRWNDSYETNQQSTNATSNRKLTAEEERNQELLRKYGNTAPPSGWTDNQPANTGMDQREVQRGIYEPMGAQEFTIDLDSGDWSSNG